MAQMELKISGNSAEEMVAQLIAMADAFGASYESENVTAEILRDIEPSLLLEIAKERFAAMGFELTVTALAEAQAPVEETPVAVEETPAKKARAPRKPKAEEPAPAPETEAQEPEAVPQVSETPAPAPAQDDDVDPEDALRDLKVDTLKRIGGYWSEKVGRAAMIEIRDRINAAAGTTYETFTAMPIELYPAVTKELDAYESQKPA